MKSEYEGSDLEAMAFASNYRRWILDDVRPFLGQRIIEVGAGFGAFSKLILEDSPSTLTAIEPSETMYGRLVTTLADADTPTSVRTFCGDLARFRETAGDFGADTIVYLNVLEHIHDDLEETRIARSVLEPEGVMIVYVPALPALFGPFDRRVGHIRRYTKPSLVAILEEAGLQIECISYRDLAGVLPWWIQARLVRSDSLSPLAVKMYDQAIPAVRRIDRILGPPIGKNLLAVARKPATATNA